MNVHSLGRACLLAATCALAACATSPTPQVSADAVTVQYAPDAWRDDLRKAPNESEAALHSTEQSLTRHIQERASRVLLEGQKLDITFTHIERAGSVEPWRGPSSYDVRIVRDIYPPRIDLTFRLLTADGSTLSSGKHELRDLGFLSRTNMYSNDPLRYEKTLLDDWVRKEFTQRP